MPARPLPLADPADPRLEALVARNLKRVGLGPEWSDTVLRLSTGDMKPSMLVCCGSGCRPCVQDLARCAARTLSDLERGETEPDPSGLRARLKHGAKRAAKGALSRARRRLLR